MQENEFRCVCNLSDEQIRYLGQYLSTKSVYGDFLKSTNKKSFRQVHAEDIAKYEEALHILKQHSPDGKFPTMKDLRTEKEQLTIQKDAQYDLRFLLSYEESASTLTHATQQLQRCSTGSHLQN